MEICFLKVDHCETPTFELKLVTTVVSNNLHFFLQFLLLDYAVIILLFHYNLIYCSSCQNPNGTSTIDEEECFQDAETNPAKQIYSASNDVTNNERGSIEPSEFEGNI